MADTQSLTPIQPINQPGTADPASAVSVAATPAQPKVDPYPTASEIMQVCVDSNSSNVKKYAPFVLKAMCSAGLTSRNQLIAIICTIYTETTPFAPIPEDGRGAGSDYGTTYYGRGFIQLTWEDNYIAAEKELGLTGLHANPDLALEPENAAKILTWFWKRNGVAAYAEKGDWQNVRSMVNAGHAGSYSYCWGRETYEPALERAQKVFTKDLNPAEIGAMPVDGSYGLGCIDPGSGLTRTIAGVQNPTTQEDALSYALGLHFLDRQKSHECVLNTNVSSEPEILKLDAQKTFELKGISTDLDGEYTIDEIFFYPLAPGGIQAKIYGYKPDPNAPAPQVFLHDTTQANAPATAATPQSSPSGSTVLPVPCWLQTDNAVQPDRTCNTSSNAMAAKFLGATIQSDDQYFQIVSKYGDSTSMEAQTAALSEIGIKSQQKTNLDFADLDRQLANGKPITISIAHRGSESSPNLNKWHVICVIGKTPNGDYIVNDPYGSVNDAYTSDPHNGCGAIYTRQTLTRRWLASGSGTGWGRLF
jgi:hypothetical protein